jgi:hypothetical protein
MIEAGSGLSLAIGIALDTSGRPVSATAGRSATPAEPDQVGVVPVLTDVTVAAVQPWPVDLATIVETDIEAFLRASGGAAEGFRRLAGKLGRPRSTVADDCHRMTIALARPN